MLWNFQNFTIKFINGEWWQQKQTNLQNNINEHFLSWLGYSKNKQINWSLKIDLKRKNQTWTLIKNYNEKENGEIGAGC